MINLQMEGLIGNNLFQYAVARILAEDLGYAMEISHSMLRPEKNVPQLLELMADFRDAPLKVEGKRFEHPLDKMATMGHEGFDGFRLDLESILNNKEDRRIEVQGFFERYEIFRKHKERLRSWFQIDPMSLGHNISQDDIVMHIRRGDYVVLGRAISLTYYLDILERNAFRKLYICGFGFDEEVNKTFRKFNPVYLHSSPLNEFRFMKGFNSIIQSQSTFSWWAGFLSEAEEIHAPITVPNSTEFEKMYPYIDLRVDDESRYHYVCNVPQMERAFTLRDVYNARHQLSTEASKRVFKYWIKQNGAMVKCFVHVKKILRNILPNKVSIRP